MFYHQAMDDFDYLNSPTMVMKSKHEPETNLAEILKVAAHLLRATLICPLRLISDESCFKYMYM